MPIPYFYPPYGHPFYPTPNQNETKRVLFEIEAAQAKTVFLAVSESPNFLPTDLLGLVLKLGSGTSMSTTWKWKTWSLGRCPKRTI